MNPTRSLHRDVYCTLHSAPETIRDQVLKTITPGEELVIRERMGGHTLKSIGESLDRCVERIRQIEAKACRKLRHPKRRAILEQGATS